MSKEFDTINKKLEAIELLLKYVPMSYEEDSRDLGIDYLIVYDIDVRFKFAIPATEENRKAFKTILGDSNYLSHDNHVCIGRDRR